MGLKHHYRVYYPVQKCIEEIHFGGHGLRLLDHDIKEWFLNHAHLGYWDWLIPYDSELVMFRIENRTVARKFKLEYPW